MRLRIYCLLGILCSVHTCYCQNSPGNIRPLSIGDTVPADLELTNVYNYPVSKIRLSDLKGKLVILDFWATWCGSCIYYLPKLDSLQVEYSKNLQVLLVNTKTTGDDEKKVSSFFEKRKKLNQKGYQLPSIINDTALDLFFPHQSVPHYVMIDQGGVVRAITASENITRKNISTLLEGKSLNVPVKRDITFDYEKPLFIDNNGGIAEHYIYRSFLTGYMDGIPSALGFNPDYTTTKTINRIFCTNASIYMLYCQAYPRINKYPPSRILLDVKEPEKYTHDGDWSVWKHQNTYCYELIIPNSPIEKARTLMQDDLKRYFGLRVVEERRSVRCLVLTYDKKTLTAISKGGVSKTNAYDHSYDPPRYFQNRPFKEFVSYLNGSLSIPIIDETGFKESIDVILPVNPKDLRQLTDTLKRYGFALQEQIRDVELFILSDKTPERKFPTSDNRTLSLKKNTIK